jgi:sporulation protein YlmC with PRC-barrel domain
MKKRLTIIALVSVLVIVFFGSSSFAQQTRWNPIETSWLIGYRVFTPLTESWSLGQIDNLVIDQSNNRIALVILSDAPGFGADRVAVPYGAIQRTGRATFRLNIPLDKIGFWGVTSQHYDVYLNKYRSAMAPGVLPKAIDANWVENLYREYDQFPYWRAEGEKPLTSFYMSNQLMGMEIQTSQAKKIGRIDDLVCDSPNGRLIFAIASCDSGKIAVPYGLMSKKGENTFVLNATESKLASAPSFYRYEDLNNRAYATDVYRYFGVQPFWRE